MLISKHFLTSRILSWPEQGRHRMPAANGDHVQLVSWYYWGKAWSWCMWCTEIFQIRTSTSALLICALTTGCPSSHYFLLLTSLYFIPFLVYICTMCLSHVILALVLCAVTFASPLAPCGTSIEECGMSESCWERCCQNQRHAECVTCFKSHPSECESITVHSLHCALAVTGTTPHSAFPWPCPFVPCVPLFLVFSEYIMLTSLWFIFFNRSGKRSVELSSNSTHIYLEHLIAPTLETWLNFLFSSLLSPL